MGRAAAECFAADGARVAVLARTKADLDTTVARLLELGAAEAFGLQADITVVIEQVEAASRGIRAMGCANTDVLVNATGPVGLGNFDQLSDRDWTDDRDRRHGHDPLRAGGITPTASGRVGGS